MLCSGYVRSARHLQATFATVLTLLACAEDERPPPAATPSDDRTCAGAGHAVEVAEEEPPKAECPAGERQILCFGDWAAHCDPDAVLVSLENCREEALVCWGQQCASEEGCTGCLACRPGSVECDPAGERRQCREDGSGHDAIEPCDEAAGLRCSADTGACEDLCATAEIEQSYIGCEYWAVATSNSQLDYDRRDADGLCRPFSFAVVVANPQRIDAEVTIESAGRSAQTFTLEPSETRAVELPCDDDLKGPFVNELTGLREPRFSVRVPGAAHHITSNVPVTVYQFNPLEFEAEGQDTLGRPTTVYSYTNDASLLLPVHSLTGDYLVMARATLFHRIEPHSGDLEPWFAEGPGFVAIVGVEDAPTEVRITSSAHTLASKDGEIPALAPGDAHTLQIEKGEVIQILSAVPDACLGEPEDSGPAGLRTFCEVSRDYDLTGTAIEAAGRVAVLAGHDCAFVPENRWACDHLEETMIPLEAWGTEIFIGAVEAVRCQPRSPSIVRVLSGADGNEVRFVPEVREPVMLDRGEHMELEVEGDVRVAATRAILVGQFLVGQDYGGGEGGSTFYAGDPAFALGIPREQWRKRYSFLVPETYVENFVNLTMQTDQVVLLDGRVVAGAQPVDGATLGTARVPVAPGEHGVESSALFGILVYGYAPYTSYMLPGGLDLNRIHRPE